MQLAHEYKYGAQIKMPVYDNTDLVIGQGLIWGQEASSTGSYNCLVDCAAVPIDVFAILAEDPSTHATNLQTPDIDKAIVQLVNVVPVWKIYWDLATGSDLDVSSSSSTVITHGSGDDNLDGCWVYINSGTGAGQLRYCKGAAATTKTVNTAFSTTPASDSDFILMRGQGRPTGGQNLSTTLDKLRSTVSATGQLLILKNFVEGGASPGELDYDIHDLDGLNARGVRFYAHIIFMDTYFSVDSI